MKVGTKCKGWALWLVLMAATGCARTGDLERINQDQAAQIASLEGEIARLRDELDQLSRSQEGLAKAKGDLEQRLKAELAGGDLSISMQNRGLVLTVLNRILFDAGKADIKSSAQSTLERMAGILAEHAGEHLISVEGHTDDQPIQFSDWKSNWELSTARATEVIHFLSEQGGVPPDRVIAVGYGEYHPLVPNDSATAREKNRRVEIVLSPRKFLEQRVEAQLPKAQS